MRQDRPSLRAGKLPASKFSALLTIFAALGACAPEVGSDAWCEALNEKSKGDWSVNEVTEFAKSCVFKTYDED
jgi:hypothetical protein